jgi:phosphoribosylamine--glycine ligase
MNVLLVGSGGREHALAWKLAGSSLLTSLHIAPGNAGMAELGTCAADLDPADHAAVERYVRRHDIGLVLIGPEGPLVAGLADHLRAMDKQAPLVIGPGAAGAQLEGSKEFAKSFMERHRIPTARYGAFGTGEADAACAFLEGFRPPYVLKADGLAAGKGVLICTDRAEAEEEIRAMLDGDKFGAAGRRMVIEEFLDGIELSAFCLTDGNAFRLLPSAKDYKRIGDGDTGPNTGGMGAVSPVPFAGPDFDDKVLNRVIIPTVKGLAKEGIPYCGFLFFGLMKVGNEPYVIEYNCRLGDPETEVILPRLRSDLLDVCVAAASGLLSEVDIDIDPRAAATVVLASEGYPATPVTGREVTGLDAAEALDRSHVFHAGTRLHRGRVVTSGGRVFACTGWGNTLPDALTAAYSAAHTVAFEGKYCRSDIGRDVVG